MMKLKDLYEDVHTQYLYHFTYDANLGLILKDNSINAEFTSDDWNEDDPEYDLFGKKIEFDGRPFVSMSRNAHALIRECNVRLRLDYTRLKSNFKIVPYRDTRFLNDEYEERVYRDIKPLNRYLVDIEVVKDRHTTEGSLANVFKLLGIAVPENLKFVERFT